MRKCPECAAVIEDPTSTACPSCGFPVPRENVLTPGVSGNSLPQSDIEKNVSPKKWHYENDGRRYGPVSLRELETLIAAGKLLRRSLVWIDGFEDWTPAEETELKNLFVGPPPIRGAAMKSEWIWVLAFAPIIGLCLELIISGIKEISASKLWWITLSLNIGLTYYDEYRLRLAGTDTSGFGKMAWLVPVYLFKRSEFLKQSKNYFIAWMISFCVVLFAPQYIEDALFAPAVEEMENSIKQDLSERVSKTGERCTKVTLFRKGKSVFKGIAQFSDGSSSNVEVTVEGRRYMWEVRQ